MAILPWGYSIIGSCRSNNVTINISRLRVLFTFIKILLFDIKIYMRVNLNGIIRGVRSRRIGRASNKEI